jgi:hypothetical protein
MDVFPLSVTRGRETARNNDKAHFLPGFLASLLLLGPFFLCSQEVSLNPDKQYEIFKKILTFDRNFKDRVGIEVVFGILFEKKNPHSVWAMEDLVKAIRESSDNRIEGLPVRIVLFDTEEVRDLSGSLKRNKVDFFYITPLKTMKVEKIVAVCRDLKVPTLTGVSTYVDEGVAVGFGVKGDKPEIIINVRAAKAQGYDFSSAFLRLARVKDGLN